LSVVEALGVRDELLLGERRCLGIQCCVTRERQTKNRDDNQADNEERVSTTLGRLAWRARLILLTQISSALEISFSVHKAVST
jgi:hypothetical protein